MWEERRPEENESESGGGSIPERNPSGARKLFPLDDTRHTGHATLTVYSRPVVRAG